MALTITQQRGEALELRGLGPSFHWKSSFSSQRPGVSLMWLGLSQVPVSIDWGISITIAGENSDKAQCIQGFLAVSSGRGLGHTAGRPEGQDMAPAVSAWRAWWSGQKDQ